MPSSKNKKILSIEKVLGPDANPHTYNFLQTNSIAFKPFSLSHQLNIIGNYVQLLGGGEYAVLLNIDGKSLIEKYTQHVEEFKNEFKNVEYVEHNKIILDNRIDGVGFYWVDLQKEFCLESMIRMEDCGRVNYGNTTLELRNHLNESHMIVVYEKTTGNIRQIKGRQNNKPEEWLWSHLYDLLTNSDYPFNQYIPTYKPENDLLITDLPLTMVLSIYNKHPKLRRFENIT